MLKARYHKLRLQFSLWRCRIWNSWTKRWETKTGPFRLTRRSLLGIYLLLMLVIGTFLMARFQAKLGESIDAGDRPPVVDQQDAIFPPQVIWGERRQPTHPESDPTNSEQQQSSQDVTDPDTLAISGPEDEHPTAPVVAQSLPLEKLYSPLGDAPVQNGYALSAKWATLGDWRPHLAVDFAAQAGADVQAAAAGTVSKLMVNDPYWGTIIIIDHGGGWTTSYSNIADPKVKAGEWVAEHQLIGQITDNPPLELLDSLHLHFILQQNGQPLDPSSLWQE